MTVTGKTEKVSLTLPRELIGQIRSVVSPGEVSSFVAAALEYYLAFRKQKIALRRGYGAWKQKQHPELEAAGSAGAYVRAVREAGAERLKAADNEDGD
jgi:Arc/MetJ-type ribon-helix-helix transcriptional regulator